MFYLNHPEVCLTLIPMCRVWFSGCCSGCPYDAQVREVRDDSLVLLWAAPLYEGSGPVTGYLVEISEGEQLGCWTAVNEKPVCDTHFKVYQAVKRAAVQNYWSAPGSAPAHAVLCFIITLLFCMFSSLSFFLFSLSCLLIPLLLYAAYYPQDSSSF